MYVRDNLRNYWIDHDEIFTMCVIWPNLKDRLILKGKGLIPGGAKTGILRFQMTIFVYKWLPWVFNDNNNKKKLFALLFKYKL